MNTLTPLLKDSWRFFKLHIISIFMIIYPLLIVNNFLYAITDSSSTLEEYALWLSVIPGILLYPVSQGIIILYMSSTISGERFTHKQYYQQSVKLWFPLFSLYIIVIIALIGGFMLLIIPGIIVMIRITFAEFNCVMSKEGPIESIFSSWAETKNHFWLLLKGLGVLILSLIITSFIIETVINFLGLNNYILWFGSFPIIIKKITIILRSRRAFFVKKTVL
jgi:hypothetical protein